MKNLKFMCFFIIASIFACGVLHSAVHLEFSGYAFGNMAFGMPTSNNNNFALEGVTINEQLFEARSTESISSGGFAGEGGILAQAGLFIDHHTEFSGYSLLAEVGFQCENMNYIVDVVSFRNEDIRNFNVGVYTRFWTVNTGVGVKAHFFDNVAIGLLVGLKFIVSDEYVRIIASDNNFKRSFTQKTVDPVYPYVKVLAEYSIPVRDNISIPIGTFLLFDGTQYLTDVTENRIFSLDLGFMAGLRYRYSFNR